MVPGVCGPLLASSELEDSELELELLSASTGVFDWTEFGVCFFSTAPVVLLGVNLGFTGVSFCSEGFGFDLGVPFPSSSSESLLEEELLSLETSLPLALAGGAFAFVSVALIVLDFVGLGGGLALAASRFCFSSSEDSLELELLLLELSSSALETGFCDLGVVLSGCCCGFFTCLTPVPAAAILPFSDPFVKVFFASVFCFETLGAFWSSDESSSLELLLDEAEEAIGFFAAVFVGAEVVGFLGAVTFAGSTSASLSESELLEEELEVSLLCFPGTAFGFVLLIGESFFAAGLVPFTAVSVLPDAATLVGFVATGRFLVSSSDSLEEEEEEEEEEEGLEEASAFFFSEAFTISDFEAVPLVSGSFGVGFAPPTFPPVFPTPLLFSSSLSDSELLEELELELLSSFFLLLLMESTLVSCAGFDFTAGGCAGFDFDFTAGACAGFNFTAGACAGFDFTAGTCAGFNFTAGVSSSDSELLLDELSEELEVSAFDETTFGALVDLGFSAVGFAPFFAIGVVVDCFTCSVSISESELESLELESLELSSFVTFAGGFDFTSLDVVLDDFV